MWTVQLAVNGCGSAGRMETSLWIILTFNLCFIALYFVIRNHALQLITDLYLLLLRLGAAVVDSRIKHHH